ncbi:hypothetical protein T484DRAFT_1631820 [Baffinella frigidus]|nr:hypothetical protein T484DRAFT_1631820 [Cryptophyta sp. CCMP2293]
MNLSGHSCQVHPQPSNLNPQPSTLNPQPSTINPQPSTINHQPSTLNPQPSTINHQSSTLNHQPSTPLLLLSPSCPPASHFATRSEDGLRVEGHVGRNYNLKDLKDLSYSPVARDRRMKGAMRKTGAKTTWALVLEPPGW